MANIPIISASGLPSISRRRFLLWSGLAVGTLSAADLLAACAQSSTSNTNVATSYTKNPIYLLGQADSGEQPVLVDGAKTFTASSGVTVNINPQPWATLLQKEEADLAASPPTYDIFWSDLEFIYSFWPHLLPLDDYIKASNYSMSGFFPSVTSNGLGIAPGHENTRYGLPIAVDTQVVWFRTDKIPTSQFPTTWAGYEAVLKEFTGAGKHALGVAGAVEQQVGRFLSRYWSIPGTKLLSPDYKPLINSEEGITALEMYKNHALKYSPPGFQGWSYTDAMNAWINGDVVIHEGWPEAVLPALMDPTKNKVIGSNWGDVAYPEGGAAQLTQHNLIIFKTTKNPKAAFDFIASQTNAARARDIITKYSVDSARQDIWEQLLPTDPNLQQFYPGWANAMKAARPFAKPLPQWVNMLLSIGTNIQGVLAGKMTSKQALDQTAAQWTTMIAQGKPTIPYQENSGV
jgi:ABC-type glycerol-3-phosphate transport system substrate-binding protein